MNISPQIEAAAASTRSESEVRQQRISMLDAIAPARERYMPQEIYLHDGLPNYSIVDPTDASLHTLEARHMRDFARASGSPLDLEPIRAIRGTNRLFDWAKRDSSGEHNRWLWNEALNDAIRYMRKFNYWFPKAGQ